MPATLRRPTTAPTQLEIFAPLDDEDMARILGTFRGQPTWNAKTMHSVQGSSDGLTPSYIWDEDTGMVWILD